MKTPNRVIAMAMLAIAAFIGNADVTTNRVYSTNHTVGDVEMTPVQQLVYAVTNAPKDSVVLIEPGTYTFTGAEYGNVNDTTTNLLYSNKSGVTIIGDTDTSRRDWTLGSEPVVIDVNGKGVLFRFTSSGCSVRNIAITSSASVPYGNCVGNGASKASYAVISNCTIRGIICGAKSSALWFKFYDCLYTGNGSCRFDVGAYNCDFIENVGAAFAWVNAYDCTFRGNRGSNTLVSENGDGYELVGCKFISNSNSNDIVCSGNCNLTVRDCEFSGNTASLCCNFSNKSGGSNDVVVSGCKFTGNKSIMRRLDTFGSNPMVGIMTVTNCQFIANVPDTSAPGTYAKTLLLGDTNCVDQCLVVDSVFTNTQYTGGFGLCNAYGVKAVRCSFASDPEALGGFKMDWNYYNEAAMESILEECDISAGDLRNCVVDRCFIHDITTNMYAVFKQYIRATNTLVVGCSDKNNKSGIGGLYSPISAQPLDAEFVNCTFASNDLLTLDFVWGNHPVTNGVRFVNCLFNGNHRRTTVSDIIMSNNNNALYYWNNFVEFSNTYYGAFAVNGKLSQAVFDAKTGENLLELCENPKFIKDSRPEAPYWSLSHRSPLLGKGDASIWTAEDIDLAGGLRLKNGMVDPGCYQCWLNPLGFSIIFR